MVNYVAREEKWPAGGGCSLFHFVRRRGFQVEVALCLVSVETFWILSGVSSFILLDGAFSKASTPWRRIHEDAGARGGCSEASRVS